jgi:hypothetical protein
MSETMKEVSAALELVAKALDSATTSSSEAATLQASTKPASPPEPSNLQETANGQVKKFFPVLLNKFPSYILLTLVSSSIHKLRNKKLF